MDNSLSNYYTAHTSGVERLFKKLKQLKSKKRNTFANERTKMLMTIMNFADDITFDLDAILTLTWILPFALIHL